MVALTGGCQCGAVRYRATGPVLSHVVCHCESCRRTTGAMAVAWYTVARSGLAFTEGRPAVRTSSQGVLRGRCLSCGTSLTYESTDQEPGMEHTIDVTTGSLDDPTAIHPDASIWVADEVPWVRGVAKLPRYPFLRGHGWIEAPVPPTRAGIRLRQVVFQAYRETLLAVRVQVLAREQGIAPLGEADVRDADCIHLLALHADHPVGTARLDTARQGQISCVAVLGDYRKQGVGRAMMLALHDIARATGLRSVWCQAQLAAVPFFEKLGYRKEGKVFIEAGVEHLILRRNFGG